MRPQTRTASAAVAVLSGRRRGPPPAMAVARLAIAVCLAGRLVHMASALKLELPDLNETPAGAADFYSDNGDHDRSDWSNWRNMGQLQREPTDVDARQQSPAVVDTQQPQASSFMDRARGFLKRKREALPSYFSFDWFIAEFNPPRYDKIEKSIRQSYYLNRMVEIFKGRIAYRMGWASYKQAPNKFSDRSPSEFKLMFQPAPPPEFDDGGDKLSTSEKFLQQLKRHERELESSKDLYKMDMCTQSSACSLGQPEESEEERAKNQIDKLLAEQRRRLAGDPNRDQLMELMEMAVSDELNGMGFVAMTQTSASGGGGPQPRPLPEPGRLRSADRMDISRPATETYQPPEFEPSQALDWSAHGCFHQIYDQGKCGRCYIMAATALAEFYKCSQQDKGSSALRRRKFSKDYVMDCAPKYTPNVMGCAGGSMLDTLRFLGLAGANTIKVWRSRREKRLQELRRQRGSASLSPEDIRCPLDNEKFSEWGEEKILMNPVQVHPNDWLEALEDGPLVVSVQMPSVGVDSYAGGVHDGQGCESSGLWHSMVLVGYGVSERGEAYWRFRNSFGPDWGDAGHFHMAMSAPANCFKGGVKIYREPCETCAPSRRTTS
jgi:hypothetical protein